MSCDGQGQVIEKKEKRKKKSKPPRNRENEKLLLWLVFSTFCFFWKQQLDMTLFPLPSNR
jgi:hypothetical protein